MLPFWLLQFTLAAQRVMREKCSSDDQTILLLVPQKMQTYDTHESYERSRKSERMPFANKPARHSQCHLFQRLADACPRHSFNCGFAHPSAHRARLFRIRMDALDVMYPCKNNGANRVDVGFGVFLLFLCI